MMSKEAMKLALKRAFQLGQDYWYQADHDSYRENKKSDETLAKFRQLVDETCEALAEPDFWEGYVPEPVGAVGSSIKSESPLGCNGPTGPAQQEPVAYQVTAYGNTQAFIKRADVADETASRLRQQFDSYADVTVHPLYTSPPAQRKPPQFPTMLRKMWSSAEVQKWINENWEQT